MLVLFAGAMATLMLVAALAFDVGLMVLERRDQQNAADAAALAGARYVLNSATGTTDCATVTGSAPAPDSPVATAWAACNVAMTNDSGNDETVLVHVPPIQGEFRGFPGFVEVEIQSARDSWFGGIIGRATWPVGVRAVAANQPGVTYSFGMLALNQTACKAIHISGDGHRELGRERAGELDRRGLWGRQQHRLQPHRRRHAQRHGPRRGVSQRR